MSNNFLPFAQACQLQKTALANRTASKPVDKLSGLEVEKLVERLGRITAENTCLKMENERLFEQFAV